MGWVSAHPIVDECYNRIRVKHQHHSFLSNLLLFTSKLYSPPNFSFCWWDSSLTYYGRLDVRLREVYHPLTFLFDPNHNFHSFIHSLIYFFFFCNINTKFLCFHPHPSAASNHFVFISPSHISFSSIQISFVSIHPLFPHHFHSASSSHFTFHNFPPTFIISTRIAPTVSEQFLSISFHILRVMFTQQPF